MTVRLAVATLLAIACGGGGGDPDPARVDGGNPAEADAAPAATIVLDCQAKQVTFPPLAKSCTAVDQCAVALHQIDCCGSLIAVGIRESERESFDTAEARCQEATPDCECAASPTLAEDGRSGNNEAIDVACRMQRCTTLIP